MAVEMKVDKVSTGCRWELIQSFCFDEDVFLCLIRGWAKNTFSLFLKTQKLIIYLNSRNKGLLRSTFLVCSMNCLKINR